MEKDAIRIATMDEKESIPLQIWYDSLRETDDGRFSSIEVLENTEMFAKRSAERKTRSNRSRILSGCSMNADKLSIEKRCSV
jgi:hypothetical protein